MLNQQNSGANRCKHIQKPSVARNFFKLSSSTLPLRGCKKFVFVRAGTLAGGVLAGKTCYCRVFLVAGVLVSGFLYPRVKDLVDQHGHVSKIER